MIWEKWGFTDLPGHDEKIDTRYEFGLKVILKGLGSKIEILAVINFDPATRKFIIVLVRLILSKVGVDRFTGPQ